MKVYSIGILVYRYTYPFNNKYRQKKNNGNTLLESTKLLKSMPFLMYGK